MNREASMPGDPVLNGVQLKSTADLWRIRPLSARTVKRLATLKIRQFVLATSGELPEVPRVHEFAFNWSNLTERGLLLRLVERPRVHTLVLWRREPLTWASNGERTHFQLPNGWTHAVDATPSVPSPGLDPAKFELELRLEATGAPIALTVKEPADYVTGAPPADEAWRERGTGRFRLGAAPPAGAAVYGAVVPIFRVVRAPDEGEVQVSRPLIEPHELRLMESPELLV